MTEVDKYLQEKVLGECWHGGMDWDRLTNHVCPDCNQPVYIEYGQSHYRRDFSTPPDYCALEDKMREEELDGFDCFLPERKGPHYEDTSEWLELTRAQRAELIAEYYKSKEQ